MKKIAQTPEFLTAILSANIGNDAAALKSDAVGFLNDKAGVDLGNNDVTIVENSSHTINLALPFYSGVGGAATSAMDEGGLDDVAGGELIAGMDSGYYYASGKTSSGAGAGAGTVGTVLGVANNVTTAVATNAIGTAMNAAMENEGGNSQQSK